MVTSGDVPDVDVKTSELVGDKRKDHPEDALVPTDAEVQAAVAQAAAEAKEVEDQTIQDVMAKIKDAPAADVAFEAAAAAASKPEETEVAVPPEPQQFSSKRMARVSFNSWFDFDAYFDLYMQETFQPFRMRSSCSVEAYRRNQQKVMLNNKSSRGRRAEFPDEAIHHHRIYMCTHAMKARCRGTNTRPGQKYRGIGCTAKINVKITPADNAAKYMVIVTDQVVTHNHPVSREIYEAYPDVLLKMMRRSQLSQSMLGHPPPPKFDTPAQTQKYERAMSALQTVAEAMARLPDEDYEQQLSQLQRIYSPEHNTSVV